jgi:hypothetical protein
MKLTLAIALLLVPSLAVADKAQEALKLLDEGVRHFNAGELPEARESFRRSHDLVPDKANPYRWMGLVDARMGRCGDAINELEIFLQKVAPSDPRVAEAVTLRDRCRQDLQPRVGALEVDSTPPGAEVRIDDPGAPAAGITPFHGDAIPAGNHVVFVRALGYEPVTRGVDVLSQQTAKIQVTLRPSSGHAPAAQGAVTPDGGQIAKPAPHKKKPYWIAGVVVGVVAAAGIAVGLGLGLTQKSPTEFPPVPPQ